MYKTNYLMLLFIATLAIGAGYLACTLKQISYPEPIVVKYERKEKLEKVKFGNLEISHTDSIEAKLTDPNLLSLKLVNLVPNNSEGEIKNTNLINIFFNKEENKKKLSIQEWWEKQGPQNQRQADYPIKEELIKIAGVDAYKTFYLINGDLNSYLGLYIYISHGTDIYEIRGYQLPKNPDPALTPEDIQAAHEYEAIFNQILQSIKFVDPVSS